MTQTEAKKRRKGRPLGDGGVGREMLLDAALRLLKEQQPSRITISSIAREAGADPALVRYYFGTRSALLAEVVDRLTIDRPPDLVGALPVTEAFARRIQSTFRFTGSARYMHRLMLEELAEADIEDSRLKLRDLNLGVIAEFQALKDRDRDGTMVDFDPLFLHLTVLAVCDFFYSAAPLLRLLLPEEEMPLIADRYTAFVVALLTDGLRRR